jgi:Ca-activated chloride channel family protein
MESIRLNQLPYWKFRPPTLSAKFSIFGMKRKRHTNVVLVLDVSGSMIGDKLNQARQGALKFLQALGDADNVSLLTFDNKINCLSKQLPLKTERQFIKKKINSLFASGSTALYDAITEAYQYLKKNPQTGKIAAIVVLSDGQDTSSQLKLDELLKQVQLTETNAILIFPIGYGDDADKTVLKSIANETKTRFYQGTIQDIEKVFLDISTFF